ncbi:hypothetical protein ACJIZ3_012652 [Penstemon smallii]|uniref:Uncharacterized protein n=1 Tax=Penstemon smallii TaxID=265156 RepID=A0ABD3UNX9_9LAMI
MKSLGRCCWWIAGCRSYCWKFYKKSWWNNCTMRWVCCWEEKMGSSSSRSSLCTRFRS